MGGSRNKTAYLIQARQRIRECFTCLPVFEQTRGEALYHYCAVLEVEALSAGADTTRLFAAVRAAAESSFQAIPAIFDRNPIGNTDRFQIDRTIFGEARDLFDFARKYEQVAFCYELADKGQFQAYVAARDPRITFAYTSAESDAVDTFLRSGELAEAISGEATPSDRESLRAAVEAVRAHLEQNVTFTSAECINYEYTPELVPRMADWAVCLAAAVPGELPSDLRVRRISIGDLRRFWGAALAISNTHDLAHLVAVAAGHKWPFGTIVNLKSTSGWECVLAAVSGLSPEAISEMLGWYVYDPRIAGKMPMIQPFLEVAPGHLCVPSLFLAGSNIERNFQKLLNRHPNLRQYADAVKRAKEPVALEQMAALFPEPEFRTEKQIILPGITDADLVVYERASGFVLVIQHKWLIAPDTATESASNDDELCKGARQATAARDYWRSNPMHLREALSLSDSEPIARIESMVVCRGAGPTGFFAPAVPVLTEKACRALLSRKNDLGHFWKLANERPDLVEASGSFRDAKATIELAGYEFVMPGLAR